MQKNESLKLLSIFHYVLGGLVALGSCIPFIHMFIGIMLLVSPCEVQPGQEPMPSFLPWLFISMAGFFITLGWTMAILIFIAATKLNSRRNRIFCITIAAIECAIMPLGTILGVFTIITLTKPDIKPLFDPQSRYDVPV